MSLGKISTRSLLARSLGKFPKRGPWWRSPRKTTEAAWAISKYAPPYNETDPPHTKSTVRTPQCGHMGVSINGGTPQWMVYRENPIKMDDLGVPPFSETPHISLEIEAKWTFSIFFYLFLVLAWGQHILRECFTEPLLPSATGELLENLLRAVNSRSPNSHCSGICRDDLWVLISNCTKISTRYFFRQKILRSSVRSTVASAVGLNKRGRRSQRGQ